jgi:hypothetical protein
MTLEEISIVQQILANVDGVASLRELDVEGSHD